MHQVARKKGYQQLVCWHICEECRIRGCHRSVTELSVFLSSNTVLLGYRFQLCERQYICLKHHELVTWWQCCIWETWILICKEISATDLTLVDFFLFLGSDWIVRGCLIAEFGFFFRESICCMKIESKYWSNNHCTFTILWFC